MAYLDARTGELVIRVVYDGAPSAGKSTNVRRLHEGLLATREGALESPDSVGRRTEWFDWREFFGGYVEGIPLRCELLSVPGQRSLAARRAHVLAEADAIVLVLDATRPETHRESLDALVATGAAVDGLVVQLNKSDRVNELDPDAARQGLTLEVPVVVASAERDEGVSATFLAAVRVATTRARRAIAEGTLATRARARGADALRDELRERERPTLPTAWRLVGDATYEPTARRVVPRAVPSTERRAWAPLDAHEWEGAGHVVHHRAEWVFETPEAAERELLELVGPHRVVLIDGRGRAFVLTRDAPTLLEEVMSCVALGAEQVALERLVEAWDALRDERGRAAVRASATVCVDGVWRHLALGSASRVPADLPSSLRSELFERHVWPDLWDVG